MCGYSSDSKRLSQKPRLTKGHQYKHLRRFYVSSKQYFWFLKGTLSASLILPLCSSKLFLMTLLFVNLQTVTGEKYSSSSSAMISSVHKRVPTGSVIHLFPRYGYLSLSMRVVPRNDSQGWVFLEPIRDIFLGSTIHIEERSFSSEDNSLPIHNEFHIDLCEDMGQLVQAYFRRFRIQGLNKPWQAFAGGWRTPSLSKYFGIDPTLVVGDYRYLLVRVLMVRNSGNALPLQNITYSSEFATRVRQFHPDDDRSIYHFANNIGTHYIHSYVTGNSLYQVFVYDAFGFDAVKKKLSEFETSKLSYMSKLPGLLPLWVKQVGKLFVLNSSPQISSKIHQVLTTETFPRVEVPNIFKLHDNPTLVREIEVLLKDEPSGLLGIELKTVDVLFKDQNLKSKFVQSLKHLMQLWEINF